MIRIFEAQSDSPLARAVVDDGLLLQADTRMELDQLITFCVQLESGDEPRGRYLVPEQGNNDSLRALYADLLAGGPRLGAIETGAASEPRWRDAVASLLDSRQRDAWQNLVVGLAAVYDTWDAPSSDGSNTIDEPQLLLAIARPRSSPHSAALEMMLSANAAALVLQPGSLFASFVVGGGVKGYRWIITVVAKAKRLLERTAQPAANRLVKGARERGGKHARHHLARLDDPREIEEKQLHKRPLVLVFLHGLFATDLGTFDGFIDRLQARNPLLLAAAIRALAAQPPDVLAVRYDALVALATQLDARVAGLGQCDPVLKRLLLASAEGDADVAAAAGTIGLVGWPHNTLTSIHDNGGALADLLSNTFGAEPPRIIFVAHSRGGLVARAAAVALLNTAGKQKWQTALAGLITFGTPHEGASIAEHDLRDLATYLMVMQSTSKVASLSDVLIYLDARTAEGIEQLKHSEATTESREQSYLTRLFDAERALRDVDGRRQPRITAIGGALDAAARATWRKRASGALVDRWLDTPDHDLVVELTSSIAPRMNAEITARVSCDHFSYFDALAQYPAATDVALARVWAELDWCAAFKAVMTAPAASMTMPGIRYKLPKGPSPQGG